MISPKTCLCLAGGGSRGIVGSAYATALKDRGIHWDGIITSSVGSLMGLLIHQDRWDELKDLWMTVKTSTVYEKYWFKGLGQKSLYNSEPLRRLINSKLDEDRIKSSDKQFLVTTTNFSTGDPSIFDLKALSRAEMVEVLLASASPPVFFSPVPYRGDQLVDAGVTSNFGLTTAINEGYDRIFVLKYPRSHMKPVKNKIDAISNTISAAMDSDYGKELAAIKKINKVVDSCNNPEIRKIEVIEICTSQPERLDYDFLDFDFKGIDREDLWYESYEEALRVLDGHKLTDPE